MITIDRLTLRTEERTLLDGVTMHLTEGAVHVLAGPAGAGKTALLDTLFGLRRPASGSVARFGRPLNRRETIYVPRDPRLYEGLTVGDVAELALGDRTDPAGELAALLDRFGLRPSAPLDDPVLQRQTALVAALLRHPSVLLLDEPFEGFGPAALRTARQLLLERQAAGTTVVVASRRFPPLADIADDLHLLEGGRIVAVYRREELARLLLGAQVSGGGKTS